MAAEGQRIAMLTAYDASFAALAERAGVDVLLVGDSLGMVVQGHRTTLPVTLDDIVYHTRCVVAGCSRPLVIADLPFGTFQGAREECLPRERRRPAGGRADGQDRGRGVARPTVEYLTTRGGVPVCGHVGLAPQSVHMLGGYKVQGPDDAAADALIGDAQARSRARARRSWSSSACRAISAPRHEGAGVPVIASARAPTARDRCWWSTTRSGFSPARPRASSATSLPATTASRPRSPPMSGRSRTARSRA